MLQEGANLLPHGILEHLVAASACIFKQPAELPALLCRDCIARSRINLFQERAQFSCCCRNDLFSLREALRYHVVFGEGDVPL